MTNTHEMMLRREDLASQLADAKCHATGAAEKAGRDAAEIGRKFVHGTVTPGRSFPYELSLAVNTLGAARDHELRAQVLTLAIAAADAEIAKQS